MSTNDQRKSDDQEIDLAALSEKIGEIFQGVNSIIFRVIRFIIRRIVVLGILFAIGVGVGLYLDKTTKVYDNKIIIQPNFGSTDYVYAKVQLLTAKINQGDTLFLKGIGIKNPNMLSSIKIEPVVDIYKFITGADKDRNEQNFELLRLMAEDGDMKKIVVDETTSKNYTFHVISFTTNRISNRKDVIEPILAFLNNSTYFNQIKEVYSKNQQNKVIANNEIIRQIDGFLNNYTKSEAGAKSDKLIYYNENTQLNEVIQTKNYLISENGRLQLDLVNINKIVKESSTTSNILNTKSINGKRKLIFPLLLIFGYLGITLFINFYKTQAAKHPQS